MKLIRYEYPQFPVSRAIDRFFDLDLPGFDRFGGLFNDVFGAGTTNEPGADLYEDKDNYYARLELPGMKKDQIDLELENSVLTVSGSREEKDKATEERFSFSRSVSIPDEVDLTKIKAAYAEGVLTVTMPKMETRKPKQIEVK